METCILWFCIWYWIWFVNIYVIVSLLQSVPLWLHYLEFVEERDADVADCTEAGIARMRALYERALTATGLHFTEGGKVWEAYRDYEGALLLSMAESTAEVIRHFFLSFTAINLTRKRALWFRLCRSDFIAILSCALQHAHDEILLHAFRNSAIGHSSF